MNPSTNNCAMRELSARELDLVSGGECTCGAGAACVQNLSSTVTNEQTIYNFYNCSGKIVATGVLLD
jgi:hypothetical protein